MSLADLRLKTDTGWTILEIRILQPGAPVTRSRVHLLYTGGTIGMERSPRGYVPMARFEELLGEMLSPRRMADMPAWDLAQFEQPIDSANIHPRDWRRIAVHIHDRYRDYDGFVVMHGTDTMAYSAASLSFMLKGLGKPVLVTGSQIPLLEVRNDAQNNLITALLLAARYPVPEVCIYFNGRLLRGNRAVKVAADRFDAFDSPNLPWLGEVGIKIEIHRQRLLGERGSPDFQLPDYKDCPVAVAQVFPGMTADWLERILSPPLDGLVLACYGVGNAPERYPGLLETLKAATGRGVVVVAVSQCREGRVDLSSYAAGSALGEAGVIGALDMTLEAAFAKLHHLLALKLHPDRVRSLMQQDLCGECTPVLPTPAP